jgi:hypothetical protein
MDSEMQAPVVAEEEQVGQQGEEPSKERQRKVEQLPLLEAVPSWAFHLLP